MKYVSLATRFRPQRFDEVAGQDLVKSVLSRASAEDRVASGYLFSGTRGVGKTTIARIFAKALNCEKAPCAEPCNECEQCRRVTAGTHPDVVELDGASNNTVDDARALRETVGFAPMEGRYKIFIIDEAHMLTRNAFNALLKTLEEPPAHVVFIFATTELFRFPATILSRCQVFSFKHLSENVITSHLEKILTKQNVSFEEAAVRLIARRAAGSARDSMSLLDQVLAYDDTALKADTVRTVLGLAGQDALGALFSSLLSGDCAGAARFTRELVSREVDLGFFLRELADNFRSLFLLTQCDRATVSSLGASDTELDFLEPLSRRFSPAWLHAAWQMVLNEQRQVSTSPNPASALELLLLNLALLPRLLPTGLVPESQSGSSAPASGAASSGQLPRSPAPSGQASSGPASSGSPPAGTATAASVATPGQTSETSGTSSQTAPQGAWQHSHQPAAPRPQTQTPSQGQAPRTTAPLTRPRASADASSESGAGAAAESDTEEPAPAPVRKTGAAASAATASAAGTAGTAAGATSRVVGGADPDNSYRRVPPVEQPPLDGVPCDEDGGEESEDDYALGDQAFQAAGQGRAPGALPSMEEFVSHVRESGDGPATYMLAGAKFVARNGDVVTVECTSSTQESGLRRSLDSIERSLSGFLRVPVRVNLVLSDGAKTAAGGGKPLSNAVPPELKHCLEILKAHVAFSQPR